MADTPQFLSTHERVVQDWLAQFERRFSRFLPDSEVNAFRKAKRGIYPLSEELRILLERAEMLRTLTHGNYDPAAGELLERAGYGKGNYATLPPEDFKIPVWTLQKEGLMLDGPTAFDLGGIGKGYAIDRVVAMIHEFGYNHFLVEGGGDMFGTTKADGSPWQVAIEYPGKPELAAGLVNLSHRGLAVSDRFRRRFGNWHHIVNPHEKKPVVSLDGCAALAPSAWAADCMTSGLFLASPERYADLKSAFQAEYLVFASEGKVEMSQGWSGELFT